MRRKLNVHVVIAGFTQTRRSWHGPAKLRESILMAINEKGRVDPLLNRVWLQRWLEDWTEIGERIWILGQHYEAVPRVNVYAYSWGAGWGFIRLAEALRKGDVKIRTAVLCDPVYRHWYWLGHWRTLVNYPITVPDNVRRVVWFRQKMNWPSGHDLLAENPRRTLVEAPIPLDVIHQKADDHYLWHDASIKAARELNHVYDLDA